jgi:hypothetical protein
LKLAAAVRIYPAARNAISKSGNRFCVRSSFKVLKVRMIVRQATHTLADHALMARSALTSRVFRWAMATHSFMLRERIEFAASDREITVRG